MATANRDDHLRNHGFIRTIDGWRLSPAFDMNPSTKRDEHVLAIDDQSPLPDLGVVLDTAEFYRMTRTEAEQKLDRLMKVLSTWESRAKALGLPAEERADLEGCFQL